MIPHLGHGGAEKVLVNLVNRMDYSRFEITVMALYDEGVNRHFLRKEVTYRYCMKRSFPGVSHVLKLFSPEFLYRHLVKDEYDIVISYLEGQTARIASGCKKKAKKLCWIHRTYTSKKDASRLFRSEKEAQCCYSAFDRIVSVSKDVQTAFIDLFGLDDKGIVLYNTNLSDFILEAAEEPVPENLFRNDELKICAMGSLIPVKGFERLISIHHMLLQDGYPVHTYILGEGNGREKLETQIREHRLEDSVTLLGYQENPYCYMKQCDLFVCSSYSEGLSTAVTEALIIGIPVITTRVSGMTELLGENNKYGIITENQDGSLYEGVKELFENPDKLESYRKQAIGRGRKFRSEVTVQAVEDYLLSLTEKG